MLALVRTASHSVCLRTSLPRELFIQWMLSWWTLMRSSWAMYIRFSTTWLTTRKLTSGWKALRIGVEPSRTQISSISPYPSVLKIDRSDVCTPHSEHHTIGIACLEAGVNVMIEKPVGITIRASKAIIAAGKKNGKLVATAENTRRGRSQRASRWLINEAIDRSIALCSTRGLA
jgi:hypothetical protein